MFHLRAPIVVRRVQPIVMVGRCDSGDPESVAQHEMNIIINVVGFGLLGAVSGAVAGVMLGAIGTGAAIGSVAGAGIAVAASATGCD